MPVTHSQSETQLNGALACFRSIRFDRRLISALLIKFSICFIVNEVRRAGTESHSGQKKKRASEGSKRGERGKSGGEGAIKSPNRQNIITESKSKNGACLVSATKAKSGNLNSSEAAFTWHELFPRERTRG